MKKSLPFGLKKSVLTLSLLFGCSLSLTAQIYSLVPYSTGFESGALDASWTTTSNQPTGQITVFTTGVLTWGGSTAYSYAGTYFLGMHNATPGGTYNLNQAMLHLNLAGETNLRFGFWWAEWNDETEVQDGVYISDDAGLTYVKVKDLNGGSYTDLSWNHFDMSLDSINTVHGLSFTSTYIIKFQQYDNYYFAGGNDGFMFDNLEIYSPCNSASSIAATVCDTYTVPSGDETYTSSGVYYDTIPNAGMCDSIIQINLTVNGATTSSISETVCDSYTAPSGAIYTTSGIYTDIIPNAATCDSIITIDLSVNSTSSSLTEIACDSYTAPSGATYTTSGMYMDVIPNAANCDSLITIDLTVNTSTTATITETALDTYTAPSGTVYTTSGIYTDTLQNAAGCDSLITINLTMEFTDVNEHMLDLITLHPNPTSGNVIIVGLDQIGDLEAVYLLNNTGSIVQVLDVESNQLNVMHLSAGMYYVQIHHAKGIDRIKLVKQ